MGKSTLLSVLIAAIFWAFKEEFRNKTYFGERKPGRLMKVTKHSLYVNNVVNTHFHNVRIK